MYLLGLVPPSNIRTEIHQFRQFIFREFCLPGIYSLPPIIPLVWTTVNDVDGAGKTWNSEPVPPFDQPPRERFRHNTLSPGELFTNGGKLYQRFNPPFNIQEGAGYIEQFESTGTLFQTGSLFLGFVSDDFPVEGVLSRRITGISWGVSDLVSLRILSFLDNQEGVCEYEELWSRHTNRPPKLNKSRE